MGLYQLSRLASAVLMLLDLTEQRMKLFVI